MIKHYTLEVLPAIEPTLRHKIEYLLKEEGFDVIGGGQNTDGSGSDISFEIEEPEPFVPFLERLTVKQRKKFDAGMEQLRKRFQKRAGK